jgi:hypothetical protein
LTGLIDANEQTRKRRSRPTFGRWHAGDPFVIPNPWGRRLGSGCMAALGFEALRDDELRLRVHARAASTSGATLDDVIAHVAALDGATDLPLSVDLENGYGPDPESAARAITPRSPTQAPRGGSIEGLRPRRRAHLRAGRGRSRVSPPRSRPRNRVSGFRSHVDGRAPENHNRGNPDLEDTIARLHGVSSAPAPNVVYATRAEQHRGRCDRLRGQCAKPVNARAARPISPSPSSGTPARRRVSVGGALTLGRRSRDGPTRRRRIRAGGDFSALSARLPLGDWFVLARRLVDRGSATAVGRTIFESTSRSGFFIARLAEESASISEYGRVHHEPKLVDEAVLEQRLDEPDAAVHDDVAVHLLLELS